ncbi:hypothetical protein [Flavilitoribacter nigricans]|uniref:Uncharacterized protein n=1 Tax=Flavilitoribacter nigricans (strain ATCC 23147 / DSM 23189 / NBRC 102662 / NCIMB 1420 / SS-2) TaxID=1122177 RepID=A0A2D0N3C2_FLAN2|nr:hypothetical protein [Flavilitoribacter nigricans]PHN03004.1 hypothetical protein CRP01_29820 [Flavilitoribacter nigricans DSM 23189 = NBRC 102662]
MKFLLTATPTLWSNEFDIFWKLGLVALFGLLSLLQRQGALKNITWLDNKDWPGITGLSALLVAVLLGFRYLHG